MSDKCTVCNRNPQQMNNKYNSECSHVECPHRPRMQNWLDHHTPYWIKHGVDINDDTDRMLAKKQRVKEEVND